MISYPHSGECRQTFPLDEGIHDCYGSMENFAALADAGKENLLVPVRAAETVKVMKVCHGCVYLRPELAHDDPDKAKPSYSQTQVDIASNVLSTHMRCTHMMSPDCLQEGDKIADPPLTE